MGANIGSGWLLVTLFVKPRTLLMGIRSMAKPLLLLHRPKYWSGRGNGIIGSKLEDACNQQTRCAGLGLRDGVCYMICLTGRCNFWVQTILEYVGLGSLAYFC